MASSTSSVRVRCGRVALVLLLCLFASCAPRFTPTPAAETVHCENVVVLVPGYKGSVLEDDRGDIQWIGVRQILFSHQSLATHGKEAIELHPAGVLRSIPLMPGVDFYDAYGEALDPLVREHPGCVVPFAYDWRLSTVTAAGHLREMLQALRAAGAKKIVVVGHSMGGLVTTLMLRSLTMRPDTSLALVDGVVLAGVPFRGTIFLVRDLFRGVSTAGNRDLLTPAAVHTFDTAYELLPENGETALVDEQGHPGPQLYDDANWDKYGWDSCRDMPGASGSFCRLERLRGFARVEALHQAVIDARPHPEGPSLPTLVIRGTGTPTLTKGLWTKDGLQFPADSQASDPRFSSFFTDGDGTVTTESSAPTPFLRSIAAVEQVDTPLAHDRLITFEPGRSALARFIRRIFEGRRGELSGVAQREIGSDAH